jgi:hypothetical protein
MTEDQDLLKKLKKETERAIAWEKWARDLARELGIGDNDSNGSIHDAKTIKHYALRGLNKNEG